LPRCVYIDGQDIDATVLHQFTIHATGSANVDVILFSGCFYHPSVVLAYIFAVFVFPFVLLLFFLCMVFVILVFLC
jgi:hypothetical protein